VKTTVAALCAVLSLGQTARPTFTSSVDGVRVDVLVTDNGRPVTGLTTADFELRDNGVRQEVSLESQRDLPLGVVLTLDFSASLRPADLEALRRAGRSLIDALVPGDSAALLTFSHRVVRQVPLTTALDKVRAGLDVAPVRGHTSLADAALAALLLGDADGGRTLVVVFSDGVDTSSYQAPEVVVETARRVNGVVYAVWAGDGDTGFLRDLTRATGGRVIDIGKAGDPGPAFLEILNEFRSRYLLTYTPAGAGAGAGGWHALDVRVTRRGARVDARPGYFSATP
jgi:VWFA-related protein